MRLSEFSCTTDDNLEMRALKRGQEHTSFRVKSPLQLSGFTKRRSALIAGCASCTHIIPFTYPEKRNINGEIILDVKCLTPLRKLNETILISIIISRVTSDMCRNTCMSRVKRPLLLPHRSQVDAG